NANISQAVAVEGDRVLVSKGYGTGAMLLQILHSPDSGWTTKKVWSRHNALRTKFTNVVIKDGYVYGLSDGIMQCVDLNTGRPKWKKGRYGHGQILLVGDVILVLSESGNVHLLEATPKKHTELTKFSAIEGKTWNNICLYGPFLLVRNAEQAACYELPQE
ncbi:MAG TPA: oxidoreductase, partial [Pirellulales bacterium]|nr:oxidoreductase [Pirellulales bacterium]